MSRRLFFSLAIFAFIQFSLAIALPPPSLAQEWRFARPKGTLKVVALMHPGTSALQNYGEGLVTLDKDNNLAACLAVDWRWMDDRTIDFKLRQGVTFYNGERFNAEAVRVNWEEYRKMECPVPQRFLLLPDETRFEIMDEYWVRFSLPEPDGLAMVKFQYFFQFAPAFFAAHKFTEPYWGFLPEPGPWGTGPFQLIERDAPRGRVVLEAYEGYWDRQYPKVKRVIFDNTLLGNRKEAMRLCRETEGEVDIVSFIRPLDTLKVAMSKFAKVVKSRDVTWFGACINQRKRESKWRDVRLRKALNYAVNRKELWKYGAKGNAYNLEGFLIPAGVYGHNPNLNLYTYDTTKARSLLAEAGYPEGFEVKIVTFEALRLEAQIVKRMLERIGLKPQLEILTHGGWNRRVYLPQLDKSPEEEDWDLSIHWVCDWMGHIGASWLVFPTDASDLRWNEYDPVYEEMWKDMARTVNEKAQEEKVRQLVQYVYDRAYFIFVYSPLMLYAVNKEVNFVPQKFEFLRLKETSVTDNHWSVRREKK